MPLPEDEGPLSDEDDDEGGTTIVGRVRLIAYNANTHHER